MALPEACGLWIEQRLKEEIEETGDSMKSVRAIARDVTDEVNRVFETNINPETIKSRALRLKNKSGSNEPPPTTHRNNDKKSGDIGDKPTIKKATEVMSQEVNKGRSTREAAKVAAEKTGQNPESVRKAHQRAEKKKQKSPATSDPAKPRTTTMATEAMQFAVIAISQLERIRSDDPEKDNAFNRVEKWIKKQRSYNNDKSDS